MRERLRQAADIAFGAAITGWRGLRRRAGEYARTGRSSRERVQERLARETDAWRETGQEQLDWAEERVRDEVSRILRRAHLVTREEKEATERELNRLRARVAELETRLRKGGDNEEEAGEGSDR